VRSNEIHIGGSAYGPIAAGRGARASQHHVAFNQVGNGSDDALLSALASLRELIEQHAAEIPEVDRVRRDTTELEREAVDEHRDPQRMRDTIVRIVGRVGMVGTILAAANDLREMIESIVH
jgi:antitoxin component HigA of HigAB toxin-antitoxin module